MSEIIIFISTSNYSTIYSARLFLEYFHEIWKEQKGSYTQTWSFRIWKLFSSNLNRTEPLQTLKAPIRARSTNIDNL